MKRPPHSGLVAGVGTALGAVILGSFLVGCAPGTICDKPGYEDACVTGGSGGSNTGSGGSGGSTGGSSGGSTGGSMGGSGAGGMGGSGGTVAASCKLWNSKEEVGEKLIVAKCGMPGGMCHANVFPPKFTTSAEAITTMLDKQPTLYCRMDKLINKADPSKSYIVAKVRGGAMVACPTGGGAGGAKMPFAPQPALSADEADCLEWWAHEVSK